MRNNKFSGRIEKLISFVGNPKSFIDVGCDHGFVSMALSNSKKTKIIYLNDISDKCLNKAKENIKKFGNEKKCIFDHGFGLDHFAGKKVETCLIAGMGGEEIVKILENKPKNLKITNLCLQPATKMIYLKRWLNQNNYKIVKDEFFEDKGVFYNIFKVKRGKQKVNELQLVFGEENLKNPSKIFVNYVNCNLQKKQSYAQNIASEKLLQEIKLLDEAKRRIDRNECRN